MREPRGTSGMSSPSGRSRRTICQRGKSIHLTYPFQRIELQVAAAHTSTNHLTSDAGQKVTVVLDPEPESGAKRLRDAFEGTLRADLTLQQFELARSLGRFWMDQNLLPENAQPKIYTVVRHPDGTFALTVKGRSEWSSMSGFATLEHYVPDYLLPFFAGLQQSSGPE